ncbi:receptor-like protein EIX2 [Vitis riparia]|uniref:receptor-like protein EIX2 n=1 Tax=Vitis riparia TaxID=96939 RepID=UPI00155A8CE4|nr:receptor-like protein EIX2 [Vitis riparia]
MNYVNLSMVGPHWAEALNKLPFLIELHLHDCGLFGSVSSPSSINLTSLSVIRISDNFLNSKFPIWLLNLSSLVSIDVSYNKLYGQISPSFGELPNLQHLDLSWNMNLTGSCSQMLRGSWKKIEALNLAGNNFLGTIPSSIGSFCNLKYLNMSYNALTGSLPEFLKETKNCSSDGLLPELLYLDLSYNQLNGRLPEWLSQLEKLTTLSLYYMWLGRNELNGSLPVSFGQLSELVLLEVTENHLTGILSEEHFSKSSKLKVLWMDGNSGLILNVSSTWVPPFQITYLDLSSCNLGPSFPTWLKFQKEAITLGLSNASISGSIPNWFWNISHQLWFLSLSFNQLQGQLPNQLNMTLGASIDFSSNLFEGPIPLPKSGCLSLDLSNNKFSGPIPAKIGESMPHLRFLFLSGNQITGIIPESIGYMQSLRIIDLSRNSLTGSIPSTISNCPHLSMLHLGKNNLSGTIPKSFGKLEWLQSLHLDKNNLSGELPSSFRYLLSLEILDLSYNSLSGNIPAWIGAAFTSLRILKLRSNKFSGGLLFELSNLSSLHILDLAENNLSGSIPACLGDLKAMAQKQNISRYTLGVSYTRRVYDDSLIVTAKGQDLEYIKTLSLIISIDLSSNNFGGEFPKDVTKLYGLMILNLSRNHINGSIPENISGLHELSSLDLSSNTLYGLIPWSMSLLTFLSYLNLSNNNFSGKIPFTGQMTTFSESAYVGNPHLCGPPLVAKCQGDDLDKGQGIVEDENDDDSIDQWFYFSIGLGFALGILGPYFVLAIKKSWCEAYFSIVDKIVYRSLCLKRGRALHGRNH